MPADWRIVILDTQVRHSLASGEYALRQKDCRLAVEQAGKALGRSLKSLRDLDEATLADVAGQLDAVALKRARHVVTENARVVAAGEAFRKGDGVRAGELMYASHASLRDDYQVSCRELDLLVEIASKVEGVYGARMTGGGFGGCAVAIATAGGRGETAGGGGEPVQCNAAQGGPGDPDRGERWSQGMADRLVQDALKQLMARKDLAVEQTEFLFEQIMTGMVEPELLAGVLVAWSIKGESVEELVGAARVMRRLATPVRCPGEPVDTCGTGGDGTSTFNVSTAAAIIAAGAGVIVAKHGNRTNTRASGSAEAMAAPGGGRRCAGRGDRAVPGSRWGWGSCTR